MMAWRGEALGLRELSKVTAHQQQHHLSEPSAWSVWCSQCLLWKSSDFQHVSATPTRIQLAHTPRNGAISINTRWQALKWAFFESIYLFRQAHLSIKSVPINTRFIVSICVAGQPREMFEGYPMRGDLLECSGCWLSLCYSSAETIAKSLICISTQDFHISNKHIYLLPVYNNKLFFALLCFDIF